MEKPYLKTFETTALEKRKKAFALILGVVIGLLVVNVFVAVLASDPTPTATALVLLVTGAALALGIRKIDAELKRRKAHPEA
jgi:hypothetical protein